MSGGIRVTDPCSARMPRVRWGCEGDGDSKQVAMNQQDARLTSQWLIAMSLFALTLGSLVGIFRLVRTHNWVRTPCTITASEKIQVHGSDGAYWRVDMEFAYYVHGVRHTSRVHDLNLGDGRSDPRLVDRYPYGASAFCYVNPLNPAQAVLTRDVYMNPCFNLITLFFLLLGVRLWWWARRQPETQ